MALAGCARSSLAMCGGGGSGAQLLQQRSRRSPSCFHASHRHQTPLAAAIADLLPRNKLQALDLSGNAGNTPALERHLLSSGLLSAAQYFNGKRLNH